MGLTGYLAGWGEGSVFRVNLPLFFGIGVIATLLYHTATFLLLQALGHDLPPVIRTYEVAVPDAIMNSILLVPTFMGVRRVLRALTGWRQIRV
jgi:hypothetical protein